MIIPFPTEWQVIKFHGSSHHQPATLHPTFRPSKHMGSRQPAAAAPKASLHRWRAGPDGAAIREKTHVKIWICKDISGYLYDLCLPMIIYLSLFIYHYLSTYLTTYVPRIPLGGPTRLVQPESSKPTSHNWGCFAGEKFYYMNTHTYIYIYIASVVILKKRTWKFQEHPHQHVNTKRWRISVQIYWLVVLTTLNNMKVNGKDYPFILWKIKFMFETTNQLWKYHRYLWKMGIFHHISIPKCR